MIFSRITIVIFFSVMHVHASTAEYKLTLAPMSAEKQKEVIQKSLVKAFLKGSIGAVEKGLTKRFLPIDLGELYIEKDTLAKHIQDMRNYANACVQDFYETGVLKTHYEYGGLHEVYAVYNFFATVSGSDLRPEIKEKMRNKVYTLEYLDQSKKKKFLTLPKKPGEFFYDQWEKVWELIDNGTVAKNAQAKKMTPEKYLSDIAILINAGRKRYINAVGEDPYGHGEFLQRSWAVPQLYQAQMIELDAKMIKEKL